jgi:hypothetical protein
MWLPTAIRRGQGPAAWLIAVFALVLTAGLPGQAVADQGGGALSAYQRSVLQGIAADTWKFYAADVDPNTHLPLDNLGPGAVRGTYTSAAHRRLPMGGGRRPRSGPDRPRAGRLTDHVDAG